VVQSFIRFKEKKEDNSNMIKIVDLYKTYKTGFLMKPKPALRGITLQVHSNEIFGFIGPNGGGKSTTIKILCGLLRIDSGTVELMGSHPSKPASRAEMGYLPEHPYFYDYLSGYELLEFYGKLVGLRGPDLKASIDRSLQMVHADQDWIHRKLRTYSKGMMQRVGLAQAILKKPKLLILDEPMSGLDPLGRKDVRETIVNLNRDFGTTIFYSSHVLGDVENISHRVGFIINGQMKQVGTLSELLVGDDHHFSIRFSSEISSSIPDFLKPTQSPLIFIVDSRADKDRALKWAFENSIEVESLESYRPNLEEVLTREIARA
jgi:ABC-2 type transport system ATP-binding protein